MSRYVLTAFGKGLNPLRGSAKKTSVTVYDDKDLQRRLAEAKKRGIRVEVKKS